MNRKNTSLGLPSELLKFVVAIVAALMISGIFILILGVNPLAAFYQLLIGVFGRVYGIGEMLVKATPLLLIAIGVSIAFKGGLVNLGGDGQFYMGALAAVYVGISLSGLTPWLHLLLAVVAAALAGAVWGGIAGFLKARLNTNEVILTIMMNYVAMYLVSYLVHGPLKEPGGFIPQTQQIASYLHLVPVIAKTRAHFGIVIALIGAVLAYILLAKTVWGYRIRAVGLSQKAAVYAGINNKVYITVVLALSGAFAGIAGMVEVYGIHFRLLDGISPGFGFTAIVVALLGQLHPAGIILASLFVGMLTAGANSMQVSVGVPISINSIIQSLVILFMLIGSKAKWFDKLTCDNKGPFAKSAPVQRKKVAQ